MLLAHFCSRSALLKRISLWVPLHLRNVIAWLEILDITAIAMQVLNPDVTEVFLKTRRRDQQRALERLYADPQLRSLQVLPY